MRRVKTIADCVCFVVLPGEADPRRSTKKKDRAVMQEIYIWDQEEILEKSTAIVVYLDQAREKGEKEQREI